MKNLPTVLYYAVKILVSTASIVFLAGSLQGCSSKQLVVDSINTGTTSRLHSQQTDVQSPSYIFQNGDQVRITIRGYQEFDTTAVIGESGTISMRLIGDLQAAGVSRSQLIEDITTKLSKYVKTDIHPVITVLNAFIQKVAVFGAVQRQENYSITTEATLMQVLAMAGGTTSDADLQHIKIFRNNDKTNFEEVDFTKYISTGNISGMPTVKPGDTVYVPREENIIRELSSFFRDTIFLFTLFTISN